MSKIVDSWPSRVKKQAKQTAAKIREQKILMQAFQWMYAPHNDKKTLLAVEMRILCLVVQV
jgi:hypothetical protein